MWTYRCVIPQQEVNLTKTSLKVSELIFNYIYNVNIFYKCGLRSTTMIYAFWHISILLTSVMPLSHQVATGRDSTNRHWSLLVATSPRLVTNERSPRLSRIVETQLRSSCVGVAWLICKKHLWQHIGDTSTISQQWGNKCRQ